MAAIVTLLGSAFNTTSGTHTVTATPAVGDLIVIIRANTGNTTSTAPTDDNSSGTYTKITSALKNTSADLLEIYVRTAFIGSASSTIFTDAAGTTTGGGLIVYKITGASVAGLSGIRSNGHSSGAGATTPAPVLSSTPLSTSAIIAAVFSASNPANLTPRTGYTESVDTGYGSPTTGIESIFVNSGETSATITYGSTSSSAHCNVAIEIIANAPPTVALNTPLDTGTVSTTTPDLKFTGTDTESNDIEYEIQLDTASTFDSVTPSISFVQSTSGINTTGGTPTIVSSAFASSNTAGNAIIVAVHATSTSSISGVADTGGNTYTLVAKNPSSGNIYNEIWVAYNITATSSNVVTATTNFADGLIFAQEWAGVTAGDQTVIGSGNSSISVGPTSTTTVANELVFASVQMDIVSGNSLDSAGTGYAHFQTASSTNILGAVETKVVSSTGTQTATMNSTNPGNGTWRGIVATFYGTKPLLDKFSVTADATFTDVTNGADTHPFASGDQIEYTVQAGNALTNGSTYYWRVRGKDPTGSTTYGAWATTRSFTVSTGTNATVTQVAANVTASGGTQVIATVNSVALIQVAGTVTASGGTQAVSTGSVVSASVTQIAGTVTANGGTQTLTSVNIVAISQTHATITASGGTQAIATVNNVALTQVAASVTATGGTQSIATVNNASISQSAATVTASGGTQTVATVNIASLSQVAGSVTATGGTQAVATIRNVQLAQLAATLTVTGGTQAIVVNTAILQVAANLTMTGGTQAIVTQRFVSLSQVAANLTATGGVQVITVLRVVSITQVAANVTVTGGTQAVLAARLVNIPQTHATLTATGGTQAVAAVVNTTVAQVAAQVTATGGSNFVTLVFAPFDNLTITSVEDTLIIKSYEDNIRITNMEEDTITVTSVEDDLRVMSIEDNIVIRA